MSNRLRRLLYISTINDQVGEADIQAILASARRHNETTGITGLLCVGGGHFIQALEGPETDVLRTYVAILDDPRHSGCIVLSFSPVAARLFSKWSMASLSNVDESVLECSFDDLIERCLQPDANEPTASLLTKFVERVKAAQRVETMKLKP